MISKSRLSFSKAFLAGLLFGALLAAPALAF
jgi:hypothetical protein